MSVECFAPLSPLPTKDPTTLLKTPHTASIKLAQGDCGCRFRFGVKQSLSRSKQLSYSSSRSVADLGPMTNTDDFLDWTGTFKAVSVLETQELSRRIIYIYTNW